MHQKISILALLLFATVASAELPVPRLDRIMPLGATAGSSVAVEIAGADLEEADRMCSIISGSQGEPPTFLAGPMP